MDRVLKLALLAVGVLACGQVARADDKSHKAAAKEVLKAMDMENQLQAGIDVAMEQMSKTSPVPLPDAQKEKIKKFLTKYMGWEGLEDDFVKIYVKTYTEDELKDIAAFYKTPTGKKMASKAAEIAKQSMELGQKRVQENQAELIKILTEK